MNNFPSPVLNAEPLSAPPRSAWQAMLGACAKSIDLVALGVRSLDADLSLAIRHNNGADFHRLMKQAHALSPTPFASGPLLELPLSLTAAIKLPTTYYLKALLSAGANPNAALPQNFSHPVPGPKENKRPLHRAVEEDRVDMVEMLIQSGANLNAADPYRQTPLIICAKRGALDCARRLIEAGASLDAIDASGASALSASLKLTPMEDPVFLSHASSGKEKRKFLETRQLRAQLASILLEAGADPKAGASRLPPFPGQMPEPPALIAAIRLLNKPLTKTLLEKGADASLLKPRGDDEHGISPYKNYINTVAYRDRAVAELLEYARAFAAHISALPTVPSLAAGEPKADTLSEAKSSLETDQPGHSQDAPPPPLSRKILARRQKAPHGSESQPTRPGPPSV